MNSEILDKFSTHLKNVLVRAYALAQELRHSSIGPEHLLFALLSQKGSIASEVLTKLQLSSEDLKNQVIELNAAPKKPSSAKTPEGKPGRKMDVTAETSPKLSADAKRVIEKAVLTAGEHEHRYVGTEHLLSAILLVAGERLEPFFQAHNLNLKTLKDQAANVLKSTSKFPEVTDRFSATKTAAPGISKAPPSKKATSKTPALDYFGIDMTAKSFVDKVDAVVGREREIERMIQVLSRKTKNNPVLLGEPGVGKTALVEGLGKKMAAGQVPPALQGKRLISVDLGLIIAGTVYRGEFESRLKQIIDEAKAHPEIILFIDELHMIMGAGAANGSLDAANILKPALARGELRCIGATTLAEYKKHIESDGALDRRFQPVQVSEPTPDEAKKIIAGLRDSFEKFHGVRITDEAVKAAVDLSVRYVQDRFLPDKAIDLIDEAAAMRKIGRSLDAPDRTTVVKVSLAEARKLKRAAVGAEDFKKATELGKREKKLEGELRDLEGSASQEVAPEVSAKDVARIVARSIGVPVEELVEGDKTRLANLEKILGERVVGQDEAVKAVADFVRRARLGLSNPNRPLATFLFLGPSGVGKTELAKVLAETVFHDKEAFIRVDMSEYAEGFNLSKLIGSPAGYVGYREPNKFTDAVKRRPYSVVLFDELEKAHPDVLNVFLQIFEDGHLTDATGKKINFKNTIIIMTSNVGSQHLAAGGRVGFDLASSDEDRLEAAYREAKSGIMQELEKHFRPEFINRIDKVVLFRPLGLESLRKIIHLHLDELNARLLSEHQVRLELTEPAETLLAKRSFQPLQGARGVRKAIQELVEGLVAESLLAGALKPGSIVRLTAKDDTLVVQKT
jgi:ATP-dependent Clp protease ATP-binding subunit ClpC